MKKIITITIEGKDAENPELVLELITGQINDGFREGFDRNEDSRYHYTVETEGTSA